MVFLFAVINHESNIGFHEFPTFSACDKCKNVTQPSEMFKYLIAFVNFSCGIFALKRKFGAKKGRVFNKQL